MNTDQMMINRQAEIISSLNEQLRTIHERHEKAIVRLNVELNQMRPYAHFYKLLQTTILENPTLSEEWERFCLLLKIADPDADKYKSTWG